MKNIWIAFLLGLVIMAGIGVLLALEALAPAPTFTWHLVAISAGCFAAAGVAAIFRPLRGIAAILGGIGLVAAFWPFVGLMAAL